MKKTIPSNYNSMDGKVKNLIELGIIDGLYIALLVVLHLPFKINIYAALLLIPLTALTFNGIGGQSLSQSLLNYIRFLRRRRILTKPSQEYIREKNKAIMLKKQKEKKSGKRK